MRLVAASLCVIAAAGGVAGVSAARAGADATTTATGTTATGTTTGTTTTSTTGTTTGPPRAALTLGARCYLVGQKVAVHGSGFLSQAPYDLTVDGVDFGQSVTSASGSLSTALVPGGLPAGLAQLTDSIDVSDGSSDVSADVTLTRRTGALFGAGKGTSARRAVPFEVWDFAPTGPAVTVYLHYVNPAGRVRTTVSLGTTHGQCGYLAAKPRQLFPFNPSAGLWRLQFDLSKTYKATAKGRVARIGVKIG